MISNPIQPIQGVFRNLRKTAPRYVLEHAVANFLLCMVGFWLIIIGDHDRWMLLFFALLASIIVQGFRTFRYIQKNAAEWARLEKDDLKEAEATHGT